MCRATKYLAASLIASHDSLSVCKLQRLRADSRHADHDSHQALQSRQSTVHCTLPPCPSPPHTAAPRPSMKSREYFQHESMRPTNERASFPAVGQSDARKCHDRVHDDSTPDPHHTLAPPDTRYSHPPRHSSVTRRKSPEPF